MFEYAIETLKEQIESIGTDKWISDKDSNYYISELQQAIKLLESEESK